MFRPLRLAALAGAIGLAFVSAHPYHNSSLAERDGADPIKLKTFDCFQNQAAAGKYGPCHNYFNQPPAVNDCAWSSIIQIFVGAILGTGQQDVTLAANSQTVETHYQTCGIQMFNRAPKAISFKPNDLQLWALKWSDACFGNKMNVYDSFQCTIPGPEGAGGNVVITMGVTGKTTQLAEGQS